MKSSGENWRGKGGASSPDTPQARSSGTDRTLLSRRPCAGQREAAAASAHAGPGQAAAQLARPPPPPCPAHLLLLSAAISPFLCRVDGDLPLGAAISSFSRAAHVPPTTQTNARPRQPPHPSPSLPPSPRLRTPRPDASRPRPRRGTRKRTVLAGTRTTQWAERRL